MFINDNVKYATIALPNFAASAALGTAAATVDVASSFTINQTVAGVVITLPAPTAAIAGDRLSVANIGTVTTTVGGNIIPAGQVAEFVWTGAAWAGEVGGRNMGGSVLAAAIAAGNSVVSHNLGLAAGLFSGVIFRAYDATGHEVVIRRNKAADTANAMGISSPVALANITFDFAPLS